MLRCGSCGYAKLVWHREWLSGFGLLIDEKSTDILTDSLGLVQNMSDGKSFTSPRKKILLAGKFLEEDIAAGRLSLIHIPGTVNVSHILTKAETPARHSLLAAQLCGQVRIKLLDDGTLVLTDKSGSCRACARGDRW